jgi:hypothetical protein
MGKGSSKLLWLGTLLLAAVGCKNGSELKPPKQPDDYRVPPLDNQRYSNPVVYPKEKSDEDSFKARIQERDAIPTIPGRPTPGIPQP